MCLSVRANVKHSEKVTFCSFPKLQHIQIYLGHLERRGISTQESIANLRQIAAACENLKRITLITMLKCDRKDEILIGLQALSKEHPSCSFILQDPWNDSSITVKAERVT